MSITIIGSLYILLSLYSFIFDRNFLYKVTIFFLPFTATAVINIGDDGSGTAVIPYMVLGSFWTLSLIIFNTKHIINLKLRRSELFSILILCLFGFVALMSLYSPWAINGSELANRTGTIEDSEPIYLTSKNITQLLYLLFGIIFGISIFISNKSPRQFFVTVKTYTISIIFVSLWGMFEFICKLFNFPYPDFIFNNSVRTSWATESILENGSLRITSVAAEPSVLNQTILIIVPFLFFGIKNKMFIFSKYVDIGLIIVFILVSIRSASGSGLLTILFMTILSFLVGLRKISTIKKMIYTSISLIAFPLIATIIYLVFQDLIYESLFNKADSYSGLERLSAVIDAWDSFLAHPLIGMGWGSVTSFDLFVRVLSNTGIIGGIIFTAFLVSVIKNLYHVKDFIYRDPLIVVFCSLIFSNAITTFCYTFGYFWLIVGLSLVTSFGNYSKTATSHKT